jgi:hypothetical protein
MSTPTYNYEWEQGADLELRFLYKEGENVGDATPVDLTGYSLRMDIRAGAVTGSRVWTFNSEDIADADPDTIGNQPDTTHEATLNADGTIVILVPRALTLDGGSIYQAMTGPSPVTVFPYDIFLRNGSGKQAKILSGNITVSASVTRWA